MADRPKRRRPADAGPGPGSAAGSGTGAARPGPGEEVSVFGEEEQRSCPHCGAARPSWALQCGRCRRRYDAPVDPAARRAHGTDGAPAADGARATIPGGGLPPASIPALVLGALLGFAVSALLVGSAGEDPGMLVVLPVFVGPLVGAIVVEWIVLRVGSRRGG